MMEIKDWRSVPTVTKLNAIARKAEKDRKSKFSSLLYLLNKEYLLECYHLLEKRKAAGIDGRTVESYTEAEIGQTLEDVANTILRGKYKPPPVKRVYIPKENGKMRSLGMPTVVDKVIQLAVARILIAVFDSSFTDSSYGYRTKRDAHACLKAIDKMVMTEKVNCILDADITAFFDNIDHTWMMRCLTERINDRAFLRLIWKWLKAGVMEQGILSSTDKGTPQGGIISPILSNIYLHFVLDLWMEVSEKKKLSGFAGLIRYADDFIIGFQYRIDAEKVYKDVQVRFAKFGLTLSAEKTKIVEFGRFAEKNERRKGRKPGRFTFLGLTHYCEKTRTGKFSVKAKTDNKRLRKSIRSMRDYLSENRIMKLDRIHKGVTVRLTGHYNYYGVSGNYERIERFYIATVNLMFKWLNRRSERKSFNREEFYTYLKHNPLPRPKLNFAFYTLKNGVNVSHRKAGCARGACPV